MEHPNLWRRLLDALRERVEKAKAAARRPAEECAADVGMRDALLEAIHEIEAAFQSGGRDTGVTTGFAGLDRLTSGSRPGELVVIASVPGMGKTVLALNVASHVAVKGAGAVAIFSLESSRQELAQRLLCSQAGVSLSRVRAGGLSPRRDFPRLQEAAANLAAAPIFVEELERPSPADLWARLKELRATQDLKLVVIDHFQMLCVSAEDEEEAERVAREMKRWARELGVVILAAAQLKAPPAERDQGRPELADLGAGRAVERHADAVVLLWRQDFFGGRPEDYDPDFSQASLILAKNRHGALGEVPLLFRKEVPRFENRGLEERLTPRE